jgi:hypothetical protein
MVCPCLMAVAVWYPSCRCLTIYRAGSVRYTEVQSVPVEGRSVHIC